MDTDKFILRKKLEDSEENTRKNGNKRLFLFINAMNFDKENSKNVLEYCFIDVFIVITHKNSKNSKNS